VSDERQRILQEIIKHSEKHGLYEDEATLEEMLAALKQVRKEMAEERAKGKQK
jgi:hypothetical protein